MTCRPYSVGVITKGKISVQVAKFSFKDIQWKSFNPPQENPFTWLLNTFPNIFFCLALFTHTLTFNLNQVRLSAFYIMHVGEKWPFWIRLWLNQWKIGYLIKWCQILFEIFQIIDSVWRVLGVCCLGLQIGVYLQKYLERKILTI